MNSMNGFGGPVNRAKPHAPSGYKYAENYTPEQWNAYDKSQNLFDPESLSYRLAHGDQEAYNELEAPALRQFSQLQGNIASRFSGGGGGAGALSSRRSSGFQNALSSAGSNFAQDLQAQRLGLRQQAIKDLQGMYNDFLRQEPYSLQAKPQQQPSGWGGILGAGLGGLGGFFAGGPSGALSGAQLGYGIGSGF